VLADPRLRPFHQSVAAGFLQRGWLRLHALLLDDRSIAVIYAFAHRNRAYSYITGFDPDAAYCSPGVLLLHRAVEQAIHDGARELDMLRGEESYKYDWGPERRENARLRVRHHGR
jgi:CelD/BcsL family acetyltransferase involved in cellulose biosynthesis